MRKYVRNTSHERIPRQFYIAKKTYHTWFRGEASSANCRRKWDTHNEGVICPVSTSYRSMRIGLVICAKLVAPERVAVDRERLNDPGGVGLSLGCGWRHGRRPWKRAKNSNGPGNAANSQDAVEVVTFALDGIDFDSFGEDVSAFAVISGSGLSSFSESDCTMLDLVDSNIEDRSIPERRNAPVLVGGLPALMLVGNAKDSSIFDTGSSS